MRILILAAGYGTRLYPLTLNMPKALISIGAQPFLNFIMAKINYLKRRLTIKEVVIVSNSRFYKKFLIWKKLNKISVRIISDGSTLLENRLGAVKDIQFVINQIRADDWLVLGSDNFFDWQLLDFVKFSLSKKPHPCIGVYNLRNLNKAKNFGVLTITRNRQIKSFIEKPKKPSAATIATCIYFLPQGSLSYLDAFLKEGRNSDLSGLYIEWLLTKTEVYGYTFKGKWMDIGHKDDLKTLDGLVYGKIT